MYAYNTIIWEVGQEEQKFKVIGSVTCLRPAWAKLDHIPEKKLFFLQVLSTYVQSQHFRLRHENEEFEASLFYAFTPPKEIGSFLLIALRACESWLFVDWGPF